MKFFQILFFILLGFWLLQWAARALLRWKLRSLQREMARRSGHASGGKRAPKEGEVRVDTGASRSRKVNERIGDYVEFEEVEACDETQP